MPLHIHAAVLALINSWMSLALPDDFQSVNIQPLWLLHERVLSRVYCQLSSFWRGPGSSVHGHFSDKTAHF